MKFPKSMHAEGFYDHIDTTASAAPKPGLKSAFKAGARPHLSTQPLLREDPIAVPSAGAAGAAAVPPAMRAPAHDPASVRRSGATPWVVGAGVGIVLVGLAVVTSRNLSGPEPAAPPAAVVGQVSPSPEDAQLQSAPPAAGTDAAASEPAVAEAPAVTAPPAVAQAPTPVAAVPAPKAEPSPPVVRAAPAPAPVAKTLAPQPEVLAQVSPPAELREPALQPLAPPVVTPAPAVVPPQATPVVPPVAQQALPATPDPEDTGITVKVRQALASDAALSAVPIAVSTEHGVVKLEGQAPDAQVRERATVVAASTAGVKAVDNRLTLPPMAALERAAGNGG